MNFESLDRDGFLVLPGLFDSAAVERMRTRVEAIAAETPQTHAGTVTTPNLVDDPIFHAAWSHDDILAAARHLVGDDLRFGGISLRGLRPGNEPQQLHVDFAGSVAAGDWRMCHAITALVDFTDANGSTRVVPGSHLDPWKLQGHKGKGRHAEECRLIGTAGTVFILNIHCAHSATQNTTSQTRLALFANFSRPDPGLWTAAASEAPPQTLLTASGELGDPE